MWHILGRVQGGAIITVDSQSVLFLFVPGLNPIFGVVLTIFFLYGAAGNQFFGGGVLGRNGEGRPIPRWLGRVWFLAMAAGSAYFTIKSLN